MTIRIVGWNCPRTSQTLMNAQAALKEIDRRGKVEWIGDLHRIIAMGIHHTPALFVNNKLKVEGRVPSVYEITEWAEQELVEEFIA